MRGALLALLAAVLIAGAYADAVRPCKLDLLPEGAGDWVVSALALLETSWRAAVLRPGGLLFAEGGRTHVNVQECDRTQGGIGQRGGVRRCRLRRWQAGGCVRVFRSSPACLEQRREF